MNKKVHYDEIISCIHSHEDLKKLYITDAIFNSVVMQGIESGLSYEEILVGLITHGYKAKNEIEERFRECTLNCKKPRMIKTNQDGGKENE